MRLKRVKRKSMLFMFLIILSVSLEAQEKAPFIEVMEDNCQVGLINEEKKMLLPADFTKIESVSIGNEWLVTGKKKTGFNYYLYQNDQLIPLTYPTVTKLSERLLMVGDVGEYGLINTEGKGILLMNYQEFVAAGVEGVITRQQNGYGAIDVNGKTILNNEYDALKYWTMGGFWGLKDGDYQLLGLDGQKIGTTVCDVVRVPSADLPVCGVRKDKKWGVVNTQNELIVNFKYKNIQFLDAGLIAVLDANKKWSLLDLNGKKISTITYDLILPCLHPQYIKVVLGNKIGLIDGSGKVVLPIEYPKIDYVGEKWMAISQGGRVQLFDLEKQQFLDNYYQAILNDIEDKAWTGFFVQQEEGWKWFDFQNGIQNTFVFKNISRMSSGFVLVEGDQRKLGVFNKNGALLLPLEYNAISPQDAFFKVKKENSDWYLVDHKDQKRNCPTF